MDTAAIYIIYFDSPDNCYIGQSVRAKTRLRKHREMLESGSHYNYKLQKAFNTSSERHFEILEECRPSELNYLETLYIKDFDAIQSGYNIVSGGDSPIGHSSSRSKYTKEQLVELYKLIANETLTLLEVSEKSNLPYSLVTAVAYGNRHLWLAEELPELAEKIKTIVATNVRSALCNDYNAKNGVIYAVIDPDGKLHHFSNISKFAKEHNLNRAHLNQVLLGKEPHHKQWRKEVQYEHLVRI